MTGLGNDRFGGQTPRDLCWPDVYAAAVPLIVGVEGGDGYWSVADSGIFFLVPRRQGSTVPEALKFFAFSTRTVTSLPAPPEWWKYQPGFSASRDGRFVLWTRLDNTVRDVMLIDPWTP